MANCKFCEKEITKENKHPICKQLQKKLWSEVELIILKEYKVLETETMRNSYYYILPFLTRLVQSGEINQMQYDYFFHNYNYYAGDKWPSWEKKYGITRPTAKDNTIAFYNGNMIVTAYISDDKFHFYRAQGFIFIEKSGFLRDLELLSENGWVILAGQGFSSREIREQLAKHYPQKPIIVVHDFDGAGNLMTDVFEKGSKRTEHLNLTFDNVLDLGLREIDVQELQLPQQPESDKYADKQSWRVELNALTTLKARDNISNPVLWYIIKRMKEENIPLHKEETEILEEIEFKIMSRIDEILHAQITRPIVEKLLNQVKFEGKTISVYTPPLNEEIKENANLLEEIENEIFSNETLFDDLGQLGFKLIEQSELIEIPETENKVLYDSQNITELTIINRKKVDFKIIGSTFKKTPKEIKTESVICDIKIRVDGGYMVVRRDNKKELGLPTQQEVENYVYPDNPIIRELPIEEEENTNE